MAKERNFEFPIISINKGEYDAVQNWITEHRTAISDKKLYIFGAGIRGNMILKLLEEAQIAVAGFCDNSVEKQGAFVKNYRIFCPNDICDNFQENYILISPENFTAIEKMLQDKGFVKEQNYSVIENGDYLFYQQEFFRKGNIEYILFGDCFFTELDVEDLHDKSMGELVVEKLGIESSKILSIHGMCIPGFYYLMKMQIEMGIIPKAVAFIVNIPFCNGIQTKLPQSQHAVLLRQIQENMRIQNSEFDQYVELAENRSRNINAKSFSTKMNAKSKDDSYVEKLLTKNRYMYEFKEDNENIEYLKKMIELLQKNNIKPIPFIPALNYYVGIDFYGQEFLNRYGSICEGIKTCVRKYGVEMLDMSFMLGRECFSGDRMTKFPNSVGKDKEIDLLCSAVRA